MKFIYFEIGTNYLIINLKINTLIILNKNIINVKQSQWHLAPMTV